MKFLKKLLLTAVFVFLLPYFLNGVHISDFMSAVLFTLALAFLNSILKPILIILSLPITVFTLGLFLIIINTLIIYIAAYLVSGVQIDGFFRAVLFSIIISIFSTVVDWVIGE